MAPRPHWRIPENMNMHILSDYYYFTALTLSKWGELPKRLIAGTRDTILIAQFKLFSSP